MRNSKILIIALLFFAGVAFRLWFASLVRQPFVFDQLQYDEFAMGILGQGFYTHSFRLYGYPLFIATIYYFTGIVNAISSLPWKAAQAVVDSMTALLLFFLAKKMFKFNAPSFIVYISYLFNPFTSTYTGVMLTEVLSAFFLALSFLFLVRFWEEKGIILLFITALVLGFFPQVRPAFLYYTIILLFAVIYQVYKSWKGKIRYTLMISVLIIYFLPFTYNIVANQRKFQQSAVTTVDNVFVKELYVSLFIDRIAYNDHPIVGFPPEVEMTFAEIGDTNNKAERDRMTQKYTDLAMTEIRKNPRKFILWRLGKLWWVWEKHFLYWYNPEVTKSISGLIYWGNCTILMVSVAGLVCWGRKYKDKWLFGLYALLYIYVSLVHTMSMAEERYSISAYPIVFLFFGYGLWYIIGRIRHSLSNQRYKIL